MYAFLPNKESLQNRGIILKDQQVPSNRKTNSRKNRILKSVMLDIWQCYCLDVFYVCLVQFYDMFMHM